MPFREGDVVVRKRRGRTLAGDRNQALEEQLPGRICRVVTSGLSYKVSYPGMGFCVLQYESSLERSNISAPSCPRHSTCR